MENMCYYKPSPIAGLEPYNHLKTKIEGTFNRKGEGENTKRFEFQSFQEIAQD